MFAWMSPSAHINTWRYKRAHPEHPDRIVNSFQKSILADQPISFVTYWGAGTKDSPDDVDQAALDRLSKMMETIRDVSPVDVKLTLILTDAHAILNGKRKNIIDSYLSKMEILCDHYGFDCIKSSKIWEETGLSFDEIRVKAGERSLQEIVESLALSSDVLSRLRISAKRHVEHDNPDEGLKLYILACLEEREHFAEKYKDSVFLTYNDLVMSFLTPPLPTISIHSFKKGTAEKPWFTN